MKNNAGIPQMDRGERMGEPIGQVLGLCCCTRARIEHRDRGSGREHRYGEAPGESPLPLFPSTAITTRPEARSAYVVACLGLRLARSVTPIRTPTSSARPQVGREATDWGGAAGTPTVLLKAVPSPAPGPLPISTHGGVVPSPVPTPVQQENGLPALRHDADSSPPEITSRSPVAGSMRRSVGAGPLLPPNRIRP